MNASMSYVESLDYKVVLYVSAIILQSTICLYTYIYYRAGSQRKFD